MAEMMRPRTLAATVVVLAVLLTGLWWLFRQVAPPAPSPIPPAAEQPGNSRGIAGQAGNDKIVQPAAEEPDDPSAALTPAQVIGNLDCAMTTGRGPARNTAVVMLPSATASRFSVIDDSGALLHGTLPFRAHNVRIGRQPDGSVVAAFADLRLNSDDNREPDADEPLRVYQGRHIVYETEKAWDFDVAPDGSSFAVLEPAAGSASRLMIRNLQTGAELQYDLGATIPAPHGYDFPFVVSYSQDNSEVMIFIFQSDPQGLGTYWFYPVDSGDPRRIIVEDSLSVQKVEKVSGDPTRITVDDSLWAALLMSSDNGYFVETPDLSESEWRALRPPQKITWQVTRRRFDPATGEASEVWRREIKATDFDGYMKLSENGRWLALDNRTLEVLDTDTGNTVFTYPTFGHLDEQLVRLENVLGPDATTADIGAVGGIGFIGNKLALYRSIGKPDCTTPPGEAYDRRRYYQCLKEHRESGAYRTFYDVFDMAGITLDGQPERRVEVYEDTSCAEGDFAYRGLKNVAGRLTYRPQ